MSRAATTAVMQPTPALSAVVELLKPITWFPPMWAFGCGVVSAGVPLGSRWPLVVTGIAVAGPLICGTSQAANDWFDRHVDSINEPHRPIPSGRIPGRWGLHIAIAWSLVSILVATALGLPGFVAALIGLSLAWAYSAPPFRLKRNGWYGNTAVAACYEGLPWFTGAAVIAGAVPEPPVIVLAALYSAGAHGIMTLNDFKSIEGDRQTGVGSLPARLGAGLAARVACVFMAVPQLLVVGLLWFWERPVHAAIVGCLLSAQVLLMTRLLRAPRDRAPWYNGTGVSLYVLGMLVSALAVRHGVTP
jgi:chlorophyll/bacteriochlorophyll a synthase